MGRLLIENASHLQGSLGVLRRNQYELGVRLVRSGAGEYIHARKATSRGL